MNISLVHKQISEPRFDPLANSKHLDDLKLHGWEMLHNAAVYSFVYGPVSIYEGLPYYYNGEDVVVIGYSVGSSRVPVSQRLRSFVHEFFQKANKDIATIEYWGAERPPEDLHRLLKCVDQKQPTNSNRDIILDLTKITSESLYAMRFVRRARKNDLHVRINTQKTISHLHADLVTKFIKLHPSLDLDGIRYVLSWKSVLERTDSVLIEVFKDSVLSGFAMISQFCERMPTYAYGFFDNNILGTSDIAHAAMINYCIRVGYSHLDLGYSINDSLLRYKTKWGPASLGDPPWSFFWRIAHR